MWLFVPPNSLSWASHTRDGERLTLILGVTCIDPEFVMVLIRC